MASRAAVQTVALIRDTFREALARKVFLGLFLCSTLLIAFFLFILRIDVVQGAIATVTIFGKENRAQDVTQVVKAAFGIVAGILYTIGMFLAIFASAGLISSVFEPGRIELLLSKPVNRWHILLGRYFGNLLVVAVNLFYLVFSVWLILGIKTHIWSGGFLISSLLTLLMFSVLLAVILLVGVLWESAAVSMIATFGLMVIGGILGGRVQIEKLLSSEWSRNILRGLYYLLPKVSDFGRMSSNLVTGVPITDWMPIWSTALFGICVLLLGLYTFQRRDF